MMQGGEMILTVSRHFEFAVTRARARNSTPARSFSCCDKERNIWIRALSRANQKSY